MIKKFDAIVVGTGQAGPSLVDRLAAAGMTVAIAERHLFGGTCVNTGCTPTKTLVASAEVIHQARRAAEYGIQIEGPIECIRFEPRGQDIAAGVRCTTGDPEVVGTHVLLAVGRRPNTDDLAVEKAGLKLDAHGYIEVDEQLRTNIPGIWALGDCNGKGAFTHTAYNDYEIVAQNLLDGRSRRVTDRIPCYGLFIDPPLGRVGMSEAQARATKRRIRVGQRPMTRVKRAVEKGESQGLMKVIVDADNNEILGAAVLGPGGDEAVHCFLDMMSARAPYTTLRDTVHIHPTVAELIPTICGETKP